MTGQDAAAPRAARPEPRLVVLLVDDQAFVGLALGRLLADEPDIELHCCHDPELALSTAAALVPAVILQDLVMPGIDGLTLVRRYRANTATASSRVIVMSGNDSAASRDDSLAAGADDYVVKLPAKADLLAALRRGVRSAPPSDASGDTLDLAVLATLRETAAPEFAAHLIDQFVEEAASCVDTIKAAARHGDAPSAQMAAHSLKGSALIVGATRLGTLCARLEGDLRADPAATVPAALAAAIDEELGAVRRAFDLERRS